MWRAMIVLLFVGRAHAQVQVGVQLNPEGEAFAAQLGVSAADLASRIQTRVNEVYGANDVDSYVRSFADATAFSGRGLGVDYVSMPTNLILGVGANFALAGSSEVTAEGRPTSGLAANLGFMAGYNLSSYDHPRWTVFANGFYRKGSTSRLSGGITSLGAHLQYRIMLPQDDAGTATKFLRWTGLDITSGIEFTRWTLGVEDTLETDFTVDGTSGSAPVIIDATGRYDLRSQAVTVPIEVSTGIRIALLVSVYVGAAVDLTGGTGELETNLTGAMRTNDNRQIGTMTMTGGGKRSASPLTGRVLAGVQLNLWKLKVYAQVNGSPTPAASIGVGIRGVL